MKMKWHKIPPSSGLFSFSDHSHFICACHVIFAFFHYRRHAFKHFWQLHFMLFWMTITLCVNVIQCVLCMYARIKIYEFSFLFYSSFNIYLSIHFVFAQCRYDDSIVWANLNRFILIERFKKLYFLDKKKTKNKRNHLQVWFAIITDSFLLWSKTNNN